MSTPTPILQYTLNNKDLLPAGYTPIAYLLSDGNLWINTGVTISGNVYAQGKVVTTDTSGERDWIGNYNNSTSGGFVVGQYNSKHYVYSSNGGSTNNGTIEANVIYEHYASLTSSKGEILANGISYTGSARNVTITNTVTLFRRGDSNCYWKGKVYFARLWQDNTLKGDWRPCIQDSNGATGMYDLVSRTFKTNSGSGTFIAGPPLAVGKGGGKSLPEEYLLVEYLESQSSIGLRINTGLTVDSNLHISMGVTLLTNSTHITPFSSDGAWKYGYNGATSNIYCDYNDDVLVSFNLESIRNKLVVFDLNKNVFIVNGNTIRTATASTFTTTNPITLFGTSSGHKTQMKGHWCKIYNNDVLIRDFYPCYRKSDMKPGMYDTVNGVFYTNAGSGEFILGPTVSPYYSWEPNAGSGTLQGLYTNISGIYDSSKGWVADFTNNTAHLSTTIPAVGNNFSVAWWELSSNFNNGSMPWGIYPFNPLYSKCLNTGDGHSNPWYKLGTTTAIDNITNSTWHHFVVTGNGSANYLYVDGVKYGLSKAFKGLTGTSLVINGWLLHTDYCRNPKISNFLIFNVALTDAQVKELYGQ